MSEPKVKTNVKKDDRNEIAKQAQKQAEFATRRRYIDLLLDLSQDNQVLETKKRRYTELKSQSDSGNITEINPDTRERYTRDGLLKTIASLNMTIEVTQKNMLYTKEDIMTLMGTRNIKIFDEATKKHFKEVEDYYNKNVVQLNKSG